MNLVEEIKEKKAKISVVGLGYVGLPLAIEFAKKASVIGFDINPGVIDRYKSGVDVTREVGNDALKATTVEFTSQESRLRDARFHIIAVPTPISKDKQPDLRPLITASQIVGRNLEKGSIIVYESTVYPGVTEDICVPVLERESGLCCGVDFKVGYSPERINPGDTEHRLDTIVKVVSGTDEDTLNTVASVYELVVKAGVYKAESIKVAEAAKVIENAQRDINIAFMNELSIIFNKLGIDTQAVLKAAETKWNFLSFVPGLVGGHCIGVDPYYLTYKAEEIGYHSQIILAGRRINDDMGKYVAENTLKKLIAAGRQIRGARVAIMGITFKENCPDVRNTRVIDIFDELTEYGIEVVVADPIADPEEVWREYRIKLHNPNEISNVDALVFAVPHNEFKSYSLENLEKLYRNHAPVLIDVKGIFDRKKMENQGYLYWRL